MYKNALLTFILASALGLGFTGSARADIIATVGEYDGPPIFDFNPLDYPLGSVLIGDFNFTPPSGGTVIGGTISGTFGNNDNPPTSDATAPSDYYIDNGLIEVAECDDALSFAQTCDTASTPTSWSYTLTANDLANLTTEISAGNVDFTVVQNFAISIETGVTTLDLVVSPEPGTIYIFLGGLAGMALLRRLRKA